MVLSNVFCVQKVVGLHNDVMSSPRYAYFTFFCPQMGPETLKFAKSQALAPARGWGQKKFFCVKKHFFSSQGLLKSVLEPFLKKNSEFFGNFSKNIAAAGGGALGVPKNQNGQKKWSKVVYWAF